MDKYTFIGLNFNTPRWSVIGNYTKSNMLDYINFDKCMDMGLKNGFEDECHCTLLFSNIYTKGVNWIVYYLVHHCSDQIKQLFNTKFELKDPIIDTFDNEDSRVLKINLTNCNLYPIMKSINDSLKEVLGGGNYDGYSPHMTITYLKPDTPDDVIHEFRDNFKLKWLSDITPTGIKVSDGTVAIEGIKL
jgi:hypothetical protein